MSLNIYSYIAEKIKTLVGDSIVAVSSYDKSSEKLMVQEMLGLGKIAKRVYEIALLQTLYLVIFPSILSKFPFEIVPSFHLEQQVKNL